MIDPSLIRQVQMALAKSSVILLIAHVDPDGDALGSLTAMGLALRPWQKSVDLVCDDGLLPRFDFLPLAAAIRRAPDAGATYDLIISLDCGDELRLGKAYTALPEPKPQLINIDHHVTNTLFGDVNVVLEASATTEILYGLFQALEVEITAEIATCLLTGLITDTLGFRTQGVTATTMKVAGALIDAGADLADITLRALTLRPFSTLHFWRMGLDKMRFEDGLVWSALSLDELAAIGYADTSSSGLVNMLADVREAAMGIVLMEFADGRVRVGFRCRPPYDVTEVAVALGGGGHALASGCTLDGPLLEAERRVVALSKETIRRQALAAGLLQDE